MRCPLCGYTENDYDEEEIRAGTWRCVCGYVHPVPGVAELRADAARLRALLRELVAYDRLGEERDYDRCHYCGAWWSVDIEHAPDCPVRMAREAVGDE